jgi:hypothetical protein
VLVAGGDTALSERTASAELFNPSTNRWSRTADMTIARGGLGLPRATVVLTSGAVLVVAASRNEPGPEATAELYSPATGEWRRTGDIDRNRLQSHTATALPDGRVMVAGGADRDRIVLPDAALWIPDLG